MTEAPGEAAPSSLLVPAWLYSCLFTFRSILVWTVDYNHLVKLCIVTLYTQKRPKQNCSLSLAHIHTVLSLHGLCIICSHLGLLWIMLWCTWMYKCCVDMFSFLSGVYLGLGLLAYMVTLCLPFRGTARLFSKSTCTILHSHQQWVKGSDFFTSSLNFLSRLP